MRRLNQSVEDHERALREVIDANAGYAETLVLSGAEVDELTDIERNAYVERLKAAQAYYKALTEQTSRQDFERDGAAAPVSAEVLQLARQARAYRDAVNAVQTEQERRQDLAREHAATIQRIQQGELESIKAELSKQLKAYDDAATELEAKLKDIEKKRLESQKRFQALADSFSSSPAPQVRQPLRM
ncbi:hypothetical protein UMZ34_24025 [Halopseudomonas pachastrellae]|nr:hypothetical protein UMZ34_24025 [Halopseudomonas pachastrellae]